LNLTLCILVFNPNLIFVKKILLFFWENDRKVAKLQQIDSLMGLSVTLVSSWSFIKKWLLVEGTKVYLTLIFFTKPAGLI